MRTAPPRVAIGLAAVTAAAYLLLPLVAGPPAGAVIGGFIPARLSGLAIPGALPVWLTPLTATLLHAGLLHLGFNLLMLVFCGREDEVALGAAGTAILYVVGAYAAAGMQFLIMPRSTVPMIGASGAISALVGAYALLYGQRRPASRWSPRIARWIHVLWLAAAWLGLQILLGFASATAGIALATPAHVGGFLAGLLLAPLLLRWRYRRA